MNFEQEFPEEGQILAELCAERAEAREQGKQLKPIVFTLEEPIIGVPKIGRNEPCPCGSGKKYKKCCIMN